jgi:hypothetical protein
MSRYKSCIPARLTFSAKGGKKVTLPFKYSDVEEDEVVSVSLSQRTGGCCEPVHRRK